MLGRYVFQLLTGLEANRFINNIKDRVTLNVHDIDNDVVIKINVILDGETESLE